MTSNPLVPQFILLVKVQPVKHWLILFFADSPNFVGGIVGNLTLSVCTTWLNSEENRKIPEVVYKQGFIASEKAIQKRSKKSLLTVGNIRDQKIYKKKGKT